MIVLFVIIICIGCSCISSVIMGSYGYTRSQWKCIPVDAKKSLFIVGRMHNFDAECMSDPKSNGCWIIEKDKDRGDDDLKETCQGFINDYPSVDTHTSSGVVEMIPYTCGPNSTHMKIWGNTGYNSPMDMCYKIAANKSFPNEMLRTIKNDKSVVL